MKKNEKKMILILLLILVIVVIVVAVMKNGKIKINKGEQQGTNEEFVTIMEDGTKINTSDKLKADKNVDGLLFQNIQLTEKNGQSVLLADVTNTTSTETKLLDVTVVILAKDGSEMAKINGMIAPLKPGEKTQFNSGITEDYANAYDFNVIINK